MQVSTHVACVNTKLLGPAMAFVVTVATYGTTDPAWNYAPQITAYFSAPMFNGYAAGVKAS